MKNPLQYSGTLWDVLGWEYNEFGREIIRLKLHILTSDAETFAADIARFDNGFVDSDGREWHCVVSGKVSPFGSDKRARLLSIYRIVLPLGEQVEVNWTPTISAMLKTGVEEE